MLKYMSISIILIFAGTKISQKEVMESLQMFHPSISLHENLVRAKTSFYPSRNCNISSKLSNHCGNVLRSSWGRSLMKVGGSNRIQDI